MVLYAKISPNIVNPRDIAGNTEEEEPLFSRSSHARDFNIGTVVAASLGTWHYRVSTRTGWRSVSGLTGLDGKFDLHFLFQCGGRYYFSEQTLP